MINKILEPSEKNGYFICEITPFLLVLVLSFWAVGEEFGYFIWDDGSGLIQRTKNTRTRLFHSPSFFINKNMEALCN